MKGDKEKCIEKGMAFGICNKAVNLNFSEFVSDG